MQSPFLAPPPRPGSQPWISLITGILGLLIFPLVIGLTIFEPSAEYPEPLHTITHDSGFLLIGGFVLSVVALVLGIIALRSRRAPQWAAITGIVTGGITLGITVLPAIGGIVTLFARHA